MAMSLSSTFNGRVAAVNEKGLKLEGHESWLNFSRFAQDLVIPERGQLVAVVTDSKNFVRSVQVVDRAPAPIRGGSGAPEATSGAHKDRTITRLAVLRSAVQLAQGRADLSSADVLKVAEVFERWVNRPHADSELVDAF